jgi:hypothetical protein
MADDFRWPVPANPPDEGVLHVCSFNVEWLPVVASVLNQLNDPNVWDSPPDDILDQVATLLDLILTNLD